MKFKSISRLLTPQIKFLILVLLIVIFTKVIFIFKEGGTNFHTTQIQSILINETIEPDSDIIISSVIGKCKRYGKTEQSACWHDALEETTKKNGLDIAYKVYEELYLTEPTFAQDCHGFTHLIGEEAFKKYTQKEDFPVTSGVTYCSYGFFHGFIEAMMKKDKSLDNARKFCDYIEQRLKGQTWTTGSCLHGIGHGVTEGSDPRALGDEMAFIEPGLKLCEKIGKTDFEIQLCATGVFNALAIIYLDPKYKLTLNRQNPYAFCDQFTKPYIKHACYDDFKTLPMVIENNNFAKAAYYPSKIPEDKYAADAMDNLSTYVIYFMPKEEDLIEAIHVCHNVERRLQVRCITGLGAGLMTAGIPDREYERALNFCRNSLLTEEERDACYGRVLDVSYSRYPKQKFHEVCKTVESPYNKYCR